MTNQQLLDIAAQYGTPLYVYDGEVMQHQYQTLLRAFAPLMPQVRYACKANSNLSMLQLLREWGSGIDAVSIEEVLIALHVGFAPTQISFTPNGVRWQEIETAVLLGVPVTIDNLPQLQRFGEQFGSLYPLNIRLLPHISAGEHARISIGTEHSKFGISYRQKEEILQIVQQYQLQVQGIHIHTGSGISEEAVFATTLQLLTEYAALLPTVQHLNLGGGFKIAYHPDDVYLDIFKIGAMVRQAIETFAHQHRRTLGVVIEPGKFLVAKAGQLIARVNLIKTTPTLTFAAIDTGFQHLIRPMLYDAHHPIRNISRPDAPLTRYDVVGYICETDTFAEDRDLPALAEADLVSIEYAGAYGFSMASNYNSRLRPAEVLWWQGKAHLIRERETIDDLLRTQIDIFS